MNSQASYANRMTDALKGHVANPQRLLALAVIARWVEDRRRDPAEEIGDEWWDLADIPREWVMRRFQNDAVQA